MYDTKYGVQQTFSTLIPFAGENNGFIVNKIVKESTQTTPNYDKILDLLNSIKSNIDYCVSYNAEYDKPLLEPWLGDCNWLCAMKDIKIPYYSERIPNLLNLAVYHGVPICSAHRALDDCLILARLFDVLGNIEDLVIDAVKRSNSPKVSVIAKVSYNDKDKAKQKGFWFDKDFRHWYKEVSQCELEKFLATLDFEYEVTKDEIPK